MSTRIKPFSVEKYIHNFVILGLLTNIVWLYDYKNTIKILLLFYGVIILLINSSNVLVVKSKAFIFLAFSILTLLINATVYVNKTGLSGYAFPVFDMVVFFVIFKYSWMNYNEDSFTVLVRHYVYVSFLISLLSIILSVDGKMRTFHGHIYGLSIDGYGYGCMASPNQSGYCAFISIAFSLYLLNRFKTKNNHFYKINLLVQIVAVYECAMREFMLVTVVCLGLVVYEKVRIKGARIKRGRTRIFLIMLSMVAVMGVSLLTLSTMSFRARDVSKTIESRKYLDVEKWNNSVEDEATAVIAYNAVIKSDILRRLDNISSRRVGIWLTALLSIRNHPFIGFPSTTIMAVMNGQVIPVDFHNAYIRGIRMYGILGFLSLFFVLMVVLRQAIRILADAGKTACSKESTVLAATVICLMAISLLGGALSASFDWTVVLLWSLAGTLMNEKCRTTESCKEMVFV